MSTENLVYLSSEQALADLAHFRVSMTELLKLQGRKWIAFGGSYPGNIILPLTSTKPQNFSIYDLMRPGINYHVEGCFVTNQQLVLISANCQQNRDLK